MRPFASTILSRALATGLVCAGTFAAVLGASGAAAQQGQATVEPIVTPAAAAIAAAATPAPADPAATATPAPADAIGEAGVPAEPTAEPAPAAEAAAAPEAAAPAAETTPEAAPTATPEATATPQTAPETKPAARPHEKAADKPRRRKAARRRSRTCATTAAGVVASAEGALPGGKAATLSSGFPNTSTSPSRCDKREATPKKRTEKVRPEIRHAEPAPTVEPRRIPSVRTDGTPTVANPTLSVAQPGPARIGVPNFFIDKFRIPPFLLPIYQAAATEYGIRWEILAAINEIETDYGRNLNVSSAGALGWMQFMPPTWKAYGVDANEDGLKDPYNPVDAIFASARYLAAAGGHKDIRKAVFAYNHANWYVDSVLMRARLIGGLPGDFVGSLTGLTQGRFPVHARATYAGGVKPGAQARKVKRGNAASIVQSDVRRKGIDVFAEAGSPVLAVNDGVVRAIGSSARLGRYVRLQDAFGNTYTYAHLGKVAATYPAPRARTVSRAQVSRELDLPRGDAAPRRAATAGRPGKARPRTKAAAANPRPAGATKQRLFAHPSRPAARQAGGSLQLAPRAYDPAADDLVRFDRKRFVAKRLRKGARVIGGTILGRIGQVRRGRAPSLRFAIRPAGRGAPRIDPKPILDGWKLLESTAIYRAAGRNPFVGADAKAPTIGQILLLSKEALERRVLTNPRIDVYACGREDIRAGSIDRRVLAALEYLASTGLRPTVSSMRCGHGLMTASGNVSQHSTGDAVDIAAINGIPIIGHQGRDSITETTIRRLLSLQGTMKPHQIISLMTFKGADNTLSMSDHADHIHVGWRPLYADHAPTRRRVDAILRPKQWLKLIDRLDSIDNPEVELGPSEYAVKVVKRPRGSR